MIVIIKDYKKWSNIKDNTKMVHLGNMMSIKHSSKFNNNLGDLKTKLLFNPKT